MLAAQSIILGANDAVVAGGMESMSNAPKYLVNSRLAFYENGSLWKFIIFTFLQVTSVDGGELMLYKHFRHEFNIVKFGLFVLVKGERIVLCVLIALLH